MGKVEDTSAFVVVVIHDRSGMEAKFYFEVQRGLPVNRIGPFLAKAATAEAYSLLSQQDRVIWDIINALGRNDDGSITHRCLGLSNIRKYILESPQVYIKRKKFGTAKRANYSQKLSLLAVYSEENVAIGVAKLLYGEIYFDRENASRLKVCWRYEGVPQPVTPVWSEQEHFTPSLLVTTSGHVVERDWYGENRLKLDLLEKLEANISFRSEGFIDTKKIESFSRLSRSEWKIFIGSKGIAVHVATEKATGVSWFDTENDRTVEKFLDFEEVAEAYLSGRGYVEVDGGIVSLPSSIGEKQNPEYLIDLLTYKDKLVPAAAIAAIRKSYSDGERESLSKKLQENEFGATLQSFQADGVLWMMSLQRIGVGGILADEMGLGKTVQTLAFCSITFSASSLILIISPASVVPNWIHEIEKFVPNSTIINCMNDIPNSAQGLMFLVVSYQGALSKAHILCERSFDLVVLDEAQFVKNMFTKTASFVRHIDSKYRLVVTGTPIENSLDDLWAHLTFLNGCLYEPYRRLTRKFLDFGRNNMAAEVSRRAFSGLIMHRTKKDVASDLPPLVERVVFCKMHDQQALIYHRTLSVFKGLLSSAVSGRVPTIALEALLRLRQCCALPSLLPASLNAEKIQSSVKIDLAEIYINEAAGKGQKTIVFSQFTGVLNEIQERMERNGIRYVRIDGSTSDRRRPVQEFQSDTGVYVFLMAFRSGGVGLNLTAAENVILLDPWWNPAAEQQAFARAHRIGQSRTVVVTKLICHGSIEEKMVELIKVKTSITEAVLGGSEKMDAREIVKMIQDL